MNTSEYHKGIKELTGSLFRFARKIVQDTIVAEDMVQESFMRLWENKSKVESSKVKAWLFTTVYRLSLDNVSLKKWMVTGLNLDFEGPVADPHDLKEVLNKCLEVLPPIQKSVLMLRDYEGYDYKEIGEILELNESQVKVYLFRARGKMKELIKDMNFVI